MLKPSFSAVALIFSLGVAWGDVTVNIPLDVGTFCDGSNTGSATGYTFSAAYGATNDKFTNSVGSISMGGNSGITPYYVPDTTVDACKSAMGTGVLSFSIPNQTANYYVRVYVVNGMDPNISGIAETTSWSMVAISSTALDYTQSTVSLSKLPAVTSNKTVVPGWTVSTDY